MNILTFWMWWVREIFQTCHSMELQIYVKNIQEEDKKLEGKILVAKSTAGGVTREEIGSLLENFKTDHLSTLGTHVDVLKANKSK